MKRNLFVVSIMLLSFASCQKDVPGYECESCDFNPVVPSTGVPLGSAVHFVMEENPDVISFYSGEIGHNYDYRDRTILEGGRLLMKFQSRVQYKPADTLDVMISTDFQGTYDSASVANAHWRNIRNMFTFPDPAAPLSTFYPSGPTDADFADLTDSVTAGQPFYLAYRYRNTAPTNILWSIGKLGMYNTFTNGVPNATVIDSNQITSGNFAAVQFTDPVTRWSTSSTYLKCTNTTQAPLNSEYWYVSRPLNPSAVAPDVPYIVKNISQSPVRDYAFTYTQRGVYKAVLVAGYQRRNLNKTIIKEFTITVY